MTDEDKAWEQFSKAETNANYSDASAQGMLQAILAELNSVKADTAKLAANDPGAPAPAEDAGGMPPMDAGMPPMGEDVPPAPEGMPGETPDMPPMGAGGADVENTAPGAGEEVPPADMGAPLPEEGMGAPPAAPTGNIFDLLLNGTEEPAEEEDLGGAGGEEEQVDKTLAALQKALSEATDPEVIVNLAAMIQDYMSKGAQEPMPEPDVPAAAPLPPEMVDAIVDEALGGGAAPAPEEALAEEPAPEEVLADLGAVQKSAPASEAPADPPADPPVQSAQSTDSTTPFQDSEDEPKKEDESEEEKPAETPMDDAEGVAITIIVGALSKDMKDVFDANHEKGISKEGLDKDTESFKVCDDSNFNKSNPIKLGIDDVMNQRLREKSGVDGKRYKITKSATEQKREAFTAIAKSVSSYSSASKMRMGDVLETLETLKKSGMPDVEKAYLPLIDEIVKYCDNSINPALTEPLFRSYGLDMSQVYEPVDTSAFLKANNANILDMGVGRGYIPFNPAIDDRMNQVLAGLDGQFRATGRQLVGGTSGKPFEDWMEQTRAEYGNQYPQEYFAPDIVESLFSMLGYDNKIPVAVLDKLGRAILNNPGIGDAWIDEVDQFSAPDSMRDYTSLLTNAGKDYLANRNLMARRKARMMTSKRLKERGGDEQNLGLAAVLGDDYKELPARLKGTPYEEKWNNIAKALKDTRYYKRNDDGTYEDIGAFLGPNGEFTASPLKMIDRLGYRKWRQARDVFGGLLPGEDGRPAIYDAKAKKGSSTQALANMVKAYQVLSGADEGAKKPIIDALTAAGVPLDMFKDMDGVMASLIEDGADKGDWDNTDAQKRMKAIFDDETTNPVLRDILKVMLGDKGRGYATRTFYRPVEKIGEDGNPVLGEDGKPVTEMKRAPILDALEDAGLVTIGDGDDNYESFDINYGGLLDWSNQFENPEFLEERGRGISDKAAARAAAERLMKLVNVDLDDIDASLKRIKGNTDTAIRNNALNMNNMWLRANPSTAHPTFTGNLKRNRYKIAQTLPKDQQNSFLNWPGEFISKKLEDKKLTDDDIEKIAKWFFPMEDTSIPAEEPVKEEGKKPRSRSKKTTTEATETGDEKGAEGGGDATPPEEDGGGAAVRKKVISDPAAAATAGTKKKGASKKKGGESKARTADPAVTTTEEGDKGGEGGDGEPKPNSPFGKLMRDNGRTPSS